MFQGSIGAVSATGWALLAPPALYALAAVLPSRGMAGLHARARLVAGAVLAVALLLGVALAAKGAQTFTLLTLLPLGPLGALALSVRLDVLTLAVLALVAFLGVVILRYSRSYLAGEPGEGRYLRWLMATLAAVALVIVANNLLLLALAWTATGLTLHQLLTFYAERPQALVAAHKKFIASRVADACLLGAILLVGLNLGSLELDQVFARLALLPALPPGLQAAALLFAAGAVLKCAQLPFHGWLIQVMEAPTPVSALLHAGVVNLGGFLMIRLAPLMAQAVPAQTLLVAVGGATALLASLVAGTRVSVKVALAWSTCAQMGFMLLECGLGAYPLALLHLVGHSLYKAHAFLGAGSAVDQWRAQAQAAGRAARSAVPALVVAALYLGWHVLLARLPGEGAAAPDGPRLALALGALCLLVAASIALQARPQSRLARAVYGPLFGGLYLDELFTRLTFRVWPPRLPRPADARPDWRCREA